jgi:hypothetical protein
MNSAESTGKSDARLRRRFTEKMEASAVAIALKYFGCQNATAISGTSNPTSASSSEPAARHSTLESRNNSSTRPLSDSSPAPFGVRP